MGTPLGWQWFLETRAGRAAYGRWRATGGCAHPSVGTATRRAVRVNTTESARPAGGSPAPVGGREEPAEP